MSWEMVKLDDCLQLITYGFTNPMPDSEEGPWKVTAKDIVDGRIDFTTARHTTVAAFENDLTDKSRPIRDDLLLTKDGTLGRLAIVGDETICINQSVALLRLKKELLLPRYLLYLLQSPEYQGKMLADAGGSTIKHIYITKVNQLMIPVPPLEVQQKLIDILSAYDRMIDSCKEQIKLLEEAAQRLYKEWFVNLRFPGYETTPITDGIPEGWTEGTLVDLAVFKRGKTITKGQVNEGNVPVVAGGLEPAYYHDTPNTDAPVITVSGSGANAGFTRMYYTKVWASDCSYIDVSVTHDIAWIYCFLKENKASIDSMQKGAAQPHVYAKDLNAMKVVVPCDSLMEQFRTAAEPMFSKIGKLEMQIKMLTEARDRLLPKLMNGEIEV